MTAADAKEQEHAIAAGVEEKEENLYKQ